jgi:hypothetical protein
MGSQGPVTLDFKGFTLTSPGYADVGVKVTYLGSPGVFNSPLTIKNGGITGFPTAIAVIGPSEAVELSHVTIDNMHISLTTGLRQDTGVEFLRVRSSTISNCTVVEVNPTLGESYGIGDYASNGGNRYINCTFTDCTYSLEVSPSFTKPAVINYMEVDR